MKSSGQGMQEDHSPTRLQAQQPSHWDDLEKRKAFRRLTRRGQDAHEAAAGYRPPRRLGRAPLVRCITGQATPPGNWRAWSVNYSTD